MAVSVALASTLSLGFLAACTTSSDDDDDDDSSVTATDTQLLKNGNFEFYTEMDEEIADRRALINSPDSWSFSSGSPSSTAASGIIDTSEDAFANLTRTGGHSFGTYTYTGANSAYTDKEVTTFSSIADAIAHWNDSDVSAYDRLYFYEIYEDDIEDLDEDSDEAEFFDDYTYSVDYDDVKNLTEMCDNGRDFTLHTGVADDEKNVLMIHNRVTSSSVVGTAQYYTSSTTITLSAGTAAEVSVWVKTAKLYHYATTDNDNESEDGEKVTNNAGAYIGVTNTVGGTSLEQMQIKNIDTNATWEQYTVHVRASTYATTTFKLVLGLGQGSSSDRYNYVNGYAFFDDITCTVTAASDFEKAVYNDNDTVKDGVRLCTVDSEKADKQFDMDNETATTYALDLYAGFDADNTLLGEAAIGLTEEKSGQNTYTTARFGLGDDENNYAKVTKLSEIASSSNKYLSTVYQNDLKDKYPFTEDEAILMLLSSNGAAYTAKTKEFTIAANEKLLVSFFVKTSAIPTDCSGASATLVETVDGMDINKTSISAFDSTTVSTTDIDSTSDDESKKDIYRGWVQCFFFVENTTEADATYRLEFSYGPTTIVGTSKTSYSDGYAAFTNFETKTLTSTEYSYASTGDRAVSVSLTGETGESKNFDTVSATASKDIETGLALPSSFSGVLGGSLFVTPDGKENVKPENVYTGLLNSKYAETYFQSSDAWTTILNKAGDSDATTWWTRYFGNARQPLVIANGEAAAYGYCTSSLTISSSSYRKISMRVRVSAGAIATVYLTNLASAEKASTMLSPDAPLVTFWYDDYGNICSMDPTDSDYSSKTGLLFELQENGLYLKKGASDKTYYANLYNYEEDDSKNLVTSSGTIAFYFKESDGKYYAYYDEATDTYSQVVENLPTEVDGKTITRYDYRNTTMPTSSITVDNTDGSLTDWVTVSFYVATGDEEATYRLEVWSGDRSGTKENPANSYVIFDNYTNEDASSDYSTILSETTSAIKQQKGLSDDDNLAENALYYTFTFYDSTSYLRYDETTDEDEEGNAYGSYTQSSYSEQLIYLLLEDKDGSVMNTGSYYVMFLDYTATDVTVEADSTDDDSTDDDSTDTTTSDTNIWLLISSGILAVVLVLVIILIIIRRIVKKAERKKRRKNNVKTSAKAKKRFAPAKDEAPEESAKENPADENDPYNN